MIRARIVGTGGYLPEKILTNDDLSEFMDTNDAWIRKRTGIEERHIAAPEQGTSDLALPAAKIALEDAGIDAGELELIVFCTITRDYIIPNSACVLQAMLGASRCAAFDVGAACSGFMYGLASANSFIQSGMFKNALVVGAEIQSQLMTWKNRDTSVLFSDGAGAVVLKAEEGERGIISTFLGADGSCGDLLHVPIGGSKTPISAENINDDPLTIHMKGPELFKRAVIEFGFVVAKALEATGLSIEDIDLFIPHQANARIIEAAVERLGMTSEQVFINIYKVGNTTAASIPYALYQARTEGRIKEGDTLLLASFGAGLTWASSILTW